MTLTSDEQLKVLTDHAVDVITPDELKTKLERGTPLRVKLGMDPTATDVHVGQAVVLRKLRRFQDLGHTAVLIVGDFTARIGDPSGEDKTRPMLSREQVDAFAEKNLAQYKLILSSDDLEVRYNSEWLEKLGVEGFLELATHYTVARTLERHDFAERYERGAAISLREFMYPLLQGYDSVAVRADVELGGTDQHFNLVVGRHLQRAYDQEPQVVLTTPLLEGTDGVKKMSQSLGNYVGITEPPDEIFGKLMRVRDDLMNKYLRLATDLSEENISELEADMAPQQLKRVLAREVVKIYQGADAADAAAQRFDRIFVEHTIPEDIREAEIPEGSITDGMVYIPTLLKELELAVSSSESRRIIEQGGLYLDGQPVTADTIAEEDLVGRVLQRGKRFFVRLVKRA